MKKFLIAALIFSCFEVSAQTDPKFRLNAYAGYVFNDQVSNYYSANDYFEGTINGGLIWGIGAEFMLHDAYGLELLYTRQDTKAPVGYWLNGPKNTEFDLSINNILLGGIRYFKLNNPVVEPYFGINAGVGIIEVDNPDNNNSGSATKFTWGLKGGTNLWVSDRFGFKAQAAFTSIVQAFGGTVYFGTGGTGAGLSGYSTVFQFSFSGGITVKLGGGGSSSK